MTVFPSWLWARGCPSESVFLGWCFMDRNRNAEARDAQRGGRVEAVKYGSSGPFPVTQTAEMFPCVQPLTIGSAGE